MTNGTRWTAKGEGATLDDLHSALPEAVAWGASEQAAHDRLWRLADADDEGGCTAMAWWDCGDFARRTNLELTGHPLTADDLRRIAECEVGA